MGYYSFDLRSHSFSCSFFKYCISRDVMQSNFFLSPRTSIGFHKRLMITSIHKSLLPHHRLIEWFISETPSI